jgi:hypothetical protein
MPAVVSAPRPTAGDAQVVPCPAPTRRAPESADATAGEDLDLPAPRTRGGVTEHVAIAGPAGRTDRPERLGRTLPTAECAGVHRLGTAGSASVGLFVGGPVRDDRGFATDSADASRAAVAALAQRSSRCAGLDAGVAVAPRAGVQRPGLAARAQRLPVGAPERRFALLAAARAGLLSRWIVVVDPDAGPGRPRPVRP